MNQEKEILICSFDLKHILKFCHWWDLVVLLSKTDRQSIIAICQKVLVMIGCNGGYLDHRCFWGHAIDEIEPKGSESNTQMA